ncbi:MAG: dihydrodipicolinate synthase family protein [Clostridia bacterium]|nr:dihydrodipicolinate synthase family protein [Clostridia bacterium]
MLNYKNEFSGIYVALITPYNSDGSVNYEAIQGLINYQLRGGVSGFFITGTSSEMLLLSDEERKKIIAEVVRAVNGRAKVIVQIAGGSTQNAIQMEKYVKSLNVDGFSAIPPIYFSYKSEQIIEYYREIAGCIDLPFFVYDYPACTGTNLLDLQFREIYNIENCLGLKESSDHHDQMKDLLKDHPRAIIFNGADEHLLTVMKFGVNAAIGSTYNVIPAPFVEIMQEYKLGNIERAEQLQKECNELIKILCDFGGIPAVKHALKMLGHNVGNCRKPFRILKEEEKVELEKLIKPYLEKYAK